MADPGGANPAMAPLEVGNGAWPPSGAETAMVELSICVNVRILAPLIDVGYGFGPPYGKPAY